MGITNRFHRFWLGQPGQSVTTWIALSLLIALVTACGFPRPPDIGDDATPAGCSRDRDCTGATPFCVNAACAACRDNTNCPITRPVCDMVSHDCRTCVKDGECDSGACDLAAGRCVDQGAILYASPNGGNADPCTQVSPCSLRHAAELVDATRLYIVLQPGRYSGGASFNDKRATIVGSQATLDILDDTLSLINISNSSSINIRDLNIDEHLPGPSPDAIAAIGANMSNVTIDDMQSTTTHLFGAYLNILGSTLTVRHSSFTGPSVASFRLIIEECVFHNFAPLISGSIEMTNSILIADSTQTSLSLTSSDPTNSRSDVAHNTFVGGTGIDCRTTSNSLRAFDSNIFYNIPTISAPSGCNYQYNLSVPNASLAGNGNTTGDPMFKDAANQDFHLKPGSAAIDAADPVDALAGHDFDGTPRPQGTRSDIGAFEYVPPP